MALGLFALGVAEVLVDVAEDIVGGTGAKLEEDVALGGSDGERFADRFATLGDDGVDGDIAFERERDPAIHGAVVAEDPGFRIAGSAAAESAESRNLGISFVPLLEPVLDVQRKGIEEREPGLDLRGSDAGFLRPELRAGSGLDHVLVEGEGGGAGAGQREEQERETGAVLLLLGAADEADTAAADQRGHLAVNADELEEVAGLGGVIGRDEDEAEGGGAGELLPQLNGSLTDDDFIERAGHQPRSRELRHAL